MGESLSWMMCWCAATGMLKFTDGMQNGRANTIISGEVLRIRLSEGVES